MNDTQKRYRNKVKRLYVDFYVKDKPLYEAAKNLNFSRFVKNMLQLYIDIDEETTRHEQEAINGRNI